MKDLAHHLKKLNRRVIRSAHREEMEDEAWETAEEMPTSEQPMASPSVKKTTAKVGRRKAAAAPKKRSITTKKLTASQLKKQAKAQVSKSRTKRAPTPKTPEEQNRLMKKRVPVFDRKNNEKLKMGARPTKKKTPRIK